MSQPAEWVLLAYRLPREPSTPRIAIWRKLKRLGVAQLLDGLVALPRDARTKERLEWIADEVVAAGGTADIWLGRPGTRAQERALTARMTEDVESEYQALVDAATDALEEGIGTRKRTVARLRRELKQVHQRDYFPKRGHTRAQAAVDRLAATIDAELASAR